MQNAKIFTTKDDVKNNPDTLLQYKPEQLSTKRGEIKLQESASNG
tara:strand:- start:836 stop:970 length:135 start_codon:yes stop_codon:yes gene_type:complete